MAKKIVNVYAPVSIRTITPPIYGTCKNISMSTGDILTCLCRRAKVEEVLPDGSTIKLDMSNYYLDNTKNIKTVNIEEKSSNVPDVAATKEDIMTDDLNTFRNDEPDIENQTEILNVNNAEEEDTDGASSMEEINTDEETSNEEFADYSTTDTALEQHNRNNHNKKHKHH